MDATFADRVIDTCKVCSRELSVEDFLRGDVKRIEAGILSPDFDMSREAVKYGYDTAFCSDCCTRCPVCKEAMPVSDLREYALCGGCQYRDSYKPPSNESDDDLKREYNEYLKSLDKKAQERMLLMLANSFCSCFTQMHTKTVADQESAHVLTHYSTASSIAETILKVTGTRDITITDATAGIGGMTSCFRNNFDFVYAVEIDKKLASYLEYNMRLFCVDLFSNFKVLHADYTLVCKALKQDVVFFDPPLKEHWVSMDKLEISGVPLFDVCKQLRGKSKWIFIKIPRGMRTVEFVDKLDGIRRRTNIFSIGDQCELLMFEL